MSKPPRKSEPACPASLDMFNGDLSVYIDHGSITASIINISLLILVLNVSNQRKAGFISSRTHTLSECSKALAESVSSKEGCLNRNLYLRSLCSLTPNLNHQFYSLLGKKPHSLKSAKHTCGLIYFFGQFFFISNEIIIISLKKPG